MYAAIDKQKRTAAQYAQSLVDSGSLSAADVSGARERASSAAALPRARVRRTLVVLAAAMSAKIKAAMEKASDAATADKKPLADEWLQVRGLGYARCCARATL